MTTRPRVLVVQHEDDCPPGLVESSLHRAGYDLDVLRAHEGRAVPVALVDHVALVVLGGQMGAEDDEDHRWLLPTRSLIATTVAAVRPFLGICLGHQLAAVALGGEVRRNPQGPLHDLAPLRPTAAADDDPFLSALPAGTTVLHWNNDIVTRLPGRAVRLADAPDGSIQAARYGARAWGVQFHPEVGPEIVERWSDGPDPESEHRHIAELGRRRTELHRAWDRLLQRFGQLIDEG